MSDEKNNSVNGAQNDQSSDSEDDEDFVPSESDGGEETVIDEDERDEDERDDADGVHDDDSANLEKETRKQEAEAMWKTFLSSDKAEPEASNSTSICTQNKDVADGIGLVSKIKSYDFAGETVEFGKMPPTKRSGGGLSSLVSQLEKKPKLSTLNKSKLDWDSYKQSQGITDELTTYNSGKDGYVEKQIFLERTDQRRFEVEKSLRDAGRKKFDSIS